MNNEIELKYWNVFIIHVDAMDMIGVCLGGALLYFLLRSLSVY